MSNPHTKALKRVTDSIPTVQQASNAATCRGPGLDEAGDIGQCGQQTVIWSIRHATRGAQEGWWQMPCTMHMAWDERLTDYHFGPSHPLAPVRFELTMRLAHEFGLWAQPGVTMTTPPPASDAELELVHDPRYIAAVRTVSGWADDLGAHGLDAAQLGYARSFGLGTGDNPVFARMHHASALVGGATLAAARAVWSGSAQHGAAIAGGMHHAMAARASGFGVYNDVAIAIAWLLAHGAERIAYVDIDAHHGDGVQTAFWDDPRVLTISLHQHPATLFPFTGLPAETGGPGAQGLAVNVALPVSTGDARWLRAFPRDRPAAAAGVPAPDAGQPARGRYSPARSAGPAEAEHRHPARRPCRDPRAGPRRGRRALATDRRRRI
jgi:acetoin utilization deacetylase AcuC-like enzyme